MKKTALRWLARLARIEARPWQVLACAAAIALACSNPAAPSRTVTIGGEPPAEPPTVEPMPVGLPPVTVSGTTLLVGGQPTEVRGITAFDLPRRIAMGDRSFLAWARDTGFNLVRVLVARQSGSYPRSHEDGIRELGPALDAIGAEGLLTEVVVFADTAGMIFEDLVDVASKISDIVRSRGLVVIELSNEPGHSTQHRALAEWHAQVTLLGLLPPHIPASAGSTHGGQPPMWNAGSMMTHHSDRSLSPEQNARIMGDAQRRFGLLVADDEALGAGEHDEPGRRTADPDYGARQVRAARANGLSWVTWHCEDCLSARVPGPRQQEAARRFIAEWRH